ncbi:MAG TPA: BspA family leucine-rich repeat surface protein, partial [bacterium]|nr:BspA family leucine-rich repeat surface protein [bacterium]
MKKNLFVIILSGLILFTSCELQKFERHVAENDEEQSESDDEISENDIADGYDANNDDAFDEDVINDEDDDRIEIIRCDSNNDCPESDRCYFNRCYSSKLFMSIWTIYNSDNTIQLPLVKNGNYDFMVDWGDGIIEKITNSNYFKTHQYEYKSFGQQYLVIIDGIIEGWQFCDYNENNEECDESDSEEISEIIQWGSLAFGDTENQFRGCSNLEITATDSPDLSKTKSLKGAFAECENIFPIGSMFSDWDVSDITNLSRMFQGVEWFNQDLSSWDVSNVTDMSY